ncbi:MAG: hypothetical protein JNL83_10475 [Myxococcales bacterium]|nr:hypothetical protein [Myxococcales bacterium]
MKRLILVFGVMGLVGCFLPMYYDYDGPESWSLWQLRNELPLMVYGVIASFGVATIVGLAGARMTRAYAAVAALAFGVVAYLFWPPVPVYVLVGWYLMMIAAYVGCVISLLATLAGTPEVSEPV